MSTTVEQIVALWGNPQNHADGTVYRVRREWRGLAALLDELVDTEEESPVKKYQEAFEEGAKWQRERIKSFYDRSDDPYWRGQLDELLKDVPSPDDE
jgi:hypothetical protein